MSLGWNIWIIGLVALNVGGALWLLWWTKKRRGGEAAPEAKTTGHTWDGDLTEYNNPLPRWWLWLFYLTVIFSFVYLAIYPGLGSYPGTLRWTQQKQHAKEVAVAERAYTEKFARYGAVDLPTLSRTPEVVAAGHNIFANTCAQCHGSDARGAVGFPNLTDHDWLWGDSPEIIEETIRNGRQAVMPPWAEALGAQGTEEVIVYVLSLSEQKVPADFAAAGKMRFEQFCVACHGPDARGNQLLGAPNLTDNIWLYGNSPQAIRMALQKGHNGQMPAHLPLLGPLKVHLVAAYVYSLSPPQTPPSQ